MEKRSHRRTRGVSPRSPSVPRSGADGSVADELIDLGCRMAGYQAPHPKSLGDLPHVFPARWSWAKSDAARNPLVQDFLMLLEGFEKGLIGEEILRRSAEDFERAMDLIASSRPEPEDLQTEIRRAARQEQEAGAEQDRVAFRCIMDGKVDADEAPELIEATERAKDSCESLLLRLRRLPGAS